MAIFKRKKKQESAPVEDKPEESKKKTSTSAAKPIGANFVLFPLLTEKATDLQTSNKYVFVVSSGANKPEIRKEVERMFDVKVEDVNILRAKPKSRRWRGIRGQKSGYKKAIVTIEEGKKIEILPA